MPEEEGHGWLDTAKNIFGIGDIGNTLWEGVKSGGHTIAHLGAEVPSMASKVMGGVMGPLGALFGGMEVGEGINELRDPKGNGAHGVIDILKGTLGIGGGAATTATALGAGSLGGGAVAAAGPVAGAGALGLGVGKLWGDWLEGSTKGHWSTGYDKNKSVFDVAGEGGVKADEAVTHFFGGDKPGWASRAAGTAAGATTAALGGIGGGIVGSVDWLGSKIGLWN